MGTLCIIDQKPRPFPPSGVHVWEKDFREKGDREAWGWTPMAQDRQNPFEDKLAALASVLKEYDRWA